MPVGRPAEPRRRPRLSDVAAAVGVSTASVSLVLRGASGPSAQTRRRVLDAAAELGYRPDRRASSLARRRSGLLGVSIDVRNSFHADLVEHLDDAAGRAGLDLVLSTATRRRSAEEAVDTLLDFGCEALVLLGAELPASRLAELAATLPLVVVGRRLDPLVADVVRADDRDGVAQAVAHLAGLGHRRITFVDGGRGTIATERRRGYRSGMRRAGLAEEISVLPGDFTEVGGARAASLLLAQRPRATAVIASNDRSALGLLDALIRAGLDAPGDVSVVGYDDSPQARWAHVDLTTVNQDAGQQARCAMGRIVERLTDAPTDEDDHGGDGQQEIVLSPHLVVRGTTAPPAGD